MNLLSSPPLHKHSSCQLGVEVPITNIRKGSEESEQPLDQNNGYCIQQKKSKKQTKFQHFATERHVVFIFCNWKQLVSDKKSLRGVIWSEVVCDCCCDRSTSLQETNQDLCKRKDLAKLVLKQQLPGAGVGNVIVGHNILLLSPVNGILKQWSFFDCWVS